MPLNSIGVPCFLQKRQYMSRDQIKNTNKCCFKSVDCCLISRSSVGTSFFYPRAMFACKYDDDIGSDDTRKQREEVSAKEGKPAVDC